MVQEEKKSISREFQNKYVRWMRTQCAHNLEKELEQTRICKQIVRGA